MVPFITDCMPVTWKNGSTANATMSGLIEPDQTGLPAILNITDAWVWMQPLGLPVVPEVYGMQARSAGVARCGPGTWRAAITSFHATTPACSGTWRGAATKSGTLRSVEAGRKSE